MNRTIGKIIKIFSLSILTLLFFITIGLSIIVNFIFTPEKITPLVTKAANETLKAKLDIHRVELTFFSTFPEFTLNIEKGNLISKVFRDTLWDKSDSLAHFEKCSIVINPIDFLKENRISVKNIRVDNAQLYAYVNEEGINNWNIVPPSSQTKDENENETKIDINGIHINEVAFNQTNLTFDDRSTKSFVRLDSADLMFNANLEKEHSDVAIEFTNKNFLLWKDGNLLIHELNSHLKAVLDYEKSKKLFSIKQMNIAINDNMFDVTGTLSKDTIPQSLVANLNYTLNVTSPTSILNIVPSIWTQEGAPQVQGEIRINGSINGNINKLHFPTATLNMKVRKGAFKYESKPYGIDHVDLDLTGFTDLSHQQPSYLQLNLLKFKGAHSEISAKVNIKDIFGNPQINSSIHSDIDFTTLARTFPLPQGVEIKGGIKTNCQTQFSLSDIKNKDYGRISVFGNIELNNMTYKDIRKDIDFYGDAQMTFIGKEHIDTYVDANHLYVHSPLGTTSLENLKATLSSSSLQDTSKIAQINCSVELRRLKGESGDSLYFFGNHTRAQIGLTPSLNNPKRPTVNISLNADSLFFRLKETNAGMDKGIIRFKAENNNDSVWTPQSLIGFKQLTINTPSLQLPINIQKTAITFKDHQLKLQNAKMNIGHSDLTASGHILNIYDAWKNNTPLKANLKLTSDNLDGNQFINALNMSETTSEDDYKNTIDLTNTQPTDSLNNEAPLKLFVLPPNIDFHLETHLKKTTFGKLLFEDVMGDVFVQHQTAYLKNLSMHAFDAEMGATVIYHASQKNKGYTGFDFRLKQVDIAHLTEVVPALDSIMPMLRSFKGIVNFEATAESQIDSVLNIQIPTLRAAMNIRGDSLVLMDGETFTEISKMLMFKNKQRNLIDSLSVNITVKNGNVTVYPFVIQMDRYRAAVGGTQDLGMNFNYHISILKSPVPFKLGINIKGNPDKMKFKLGKAKYKDQVTPAAIMKVDTTRINLGRNIIHDFERIMDNARRKQNKTVK